MAAAFRVACAGGSEESLFFWRAVNVEIWLRVYFEGAAHGSAGADGGTRFSFAAHGDRRGGGGGRGARPWWRPPVPTPAGT